MTHATLASAAAASRLEFVRRAAELGLACCCVDAQGAANASPDVQAAAAEARVTGHRVRRTSVQSDLLAFADGDGAVVVDLLSAGATASHRDQLAAVLTHYREDLARAATDALAIGGFNSQLSQSYEEVNFTFHMAKLLTSTAEPDQVVQSMCDELRGTLGYGWLTMTFSADDSVLAALRGVALSAGTLPLPWPDMAGEIAKIVADRRSGVLTPASHPFAARAGYELLAENVLHGDTPMGLLIAGDRQGGDSDVSSGEIQLVHAAASFLGLFHENAFRFAAQRQQFIGTLNALSAAVDAKDPYTHGHSERVGLIASQLAAKVGFDAAKVEAVRVAGLLHDIGKIGVPENVLCKPARLTDEEFALIKQHPDIGYGILKDLPSLAFHLPGVLHHHERFDGRGYPHKLSGEQIPLIARMLALADTFDAMSSTRAYRAAMDRTRVLDEIRKSAGVQFDPALVEPFLSLDFTEFDRMIEAGRAAAAAPAPAPEALAA